MENAEAQIPLRDAISASFDAVMVDDAPAPDAPAIVETDAQKTERLRDEAGRFAKDEKAAAPAAPQAAKPGTAPETPAPPPETKRAARPSSWKKDFEPHWEKLDPQLQEYIGQREREYASGVSTYKHEADSARSLNEAIAPFLPNLQKHGLDPTQWIRNLGTAHERLALGSPQEKVALGAQLIRDYGIDPNALFQMLSQPQQQRYTPPPPQINIDEVVEQKLTQREIQSEFNRFVAEAPEKYPHYEAVKGTMAGLLQAGLAQDYKTAYEAALRHPQHDAIWQQEQQQRQQEQIAAEAAKKQGVVNRARSQAVSVKSSTPSGNMTAAQGNKSLRDMLSESFDSVQSSRV